MNNIQRAFAIGALLFSYLGSTVSCSALLYEPPGEPVHRITISGYPVSVVHTCTSDSGELELMAVMDMGGGDHLFAAGSSDTSENCLEAAALIQSEINDGDNEKIELGGYYLGDAFKMELIRANGLFALLYPLQF